MKYAETIEWFKERGINKTKRQLKYMVDHKQIPFVQVSEHRVEFRACKLSKWLERNEHIPV